MKIFPLTNTSRVGFICKCCVSLLAQSKEREAAIAYNMQASKLFTAPHLNEVT